jgi:hypothetical protein
MTLVSGTAYHSFGGEVEASNTLTIRRLTPSCRHQLPRIAPHLLQLFHEKKITEHIAFKGGTTIFSNITFL